MEYIQKSINNLIDNGDKTASSSKEKRRSWFEMLTRDKSPAVGDREVAKPRSSRDSAELSRSSSETESFEDVDFDLDFERALEIDCDDSDFLKGENQQEEQGIWSDWKVNSEKMRNKAKAAWNNMKYGWTIKRKTNFDEKSLIWVLGRYYYPKRLEEKFSERSPPPPVSETDFDYLDFMTDFTTRIWLTYRSGFPTLDGTSLKTDCGWGCMLRSGQMMLAQALILHLLGRDWNIFYPPTANTSRCHRRIIQCFGDQIECPLSIHQLISVGWHRHGKKPGDWYGPASVAFLLRDAMESDVAQSDAILRDLKIYVAKDCTVSLDEIEALCTGVTVTDLVKTRNSPEKPDFGKWRKSLVLIVPLRLGAEKLNHAYSDHLKMLFSIKNCLGLIGGRPKHSMYFVGFHARSLVYLDSHLCHQYTDVLKPHFPIHSFHCRWPKKMHISSMDPSCAVGFYCYDRASLFQLIADLEDVIECTSSMINRGSAPAPTPGPSSSLADLDRQSSDPSSEVSAAEVLTDADVINFGSAPSSPQKARKPIRLIRHPLFSVVDSVQKHDFDKVSAANIRRMSFKSRQAHDKSVKQAKKHGFELL